MAISRSVPFLRVVPHNAKQSVASVRARGEQFRSYAKLNGRQVSAYRSIEARVKYGLAFANQVKYVPFEFLNKAIYDRPLFATEVEVGF